MAEEFGQYNFNFIYYVIQKAEITDNTLTIEGMNGYTVGRIIFEELEEGFEIDERMIGGKVFGIKRKPIDNGFTVFRIVIDDAQITQTDIVAKNMVFIMLGTVRSKEIPFHFLHVQNVNQAIENIYSVVKAEVE